MSGKRKWTAKWKGNAALAFNEGYLLEYSGKRVKTSECRLCRAALKLNRSQPVDDDGIVFVQPCACKAGSNIINLDRFLSIFETEEAITFYDELKKRKQRNWTTAGLDVGSLKYFIDKYGPEEGERRFREKNQKCSTTTQEYFEKKGLSPQEAKRALRIRQGTRSLDAAFSRDGRLGVERWISTNAKWRQKLPSGQAPHNHLEPSLIYAAEQKAQYMWLVTVLTDLSKRLGQIIPPENMEVDHKFSRVAAFHLGVNPKILCAEPNLRIIHRDTNLAKKDLCSVTCYNLHELYKQYQESERGKLYDDISETLLDCVGYQWSGW